MNDGLTASTACDATTAADRELSSSPPLTPSLRGPVLLTLRRSHGLRAYQDAITKEFFTLKAPKTEHVRIPNIRDRSNNNMVERLHGTIRQRNKVMRGLNAENSAQAMMDGLRIYYNFIRPHAALNGRTPAQKANIETDEAKWVSLIKKASRHQRFEASP